MENNLLDELKDFLIRQTIKIFETGNPNELILSPKHTIRLKLEILNNRYIQTIEDLTKQSNKVANKFIQALSESFTFQSPRFFIYNKPYQVQNLLDLISSISATIELFESLKQNFNQSHPTISNELTPTHIIRRFNSKTYELHTNEKTSKHFKEFFILIDKNDYEKNSTKVSIKCFYLKKLDSEPNDAKAKNASSKAKMVYNKQVDYTEIESSEFIKQLNLIISRDLLGLSFNSEIF